VAGAEGVAIAAATDAAVAEPSVAESAPVDAAESAPVDVAESAPVDVAESTPVDAADAALVDVPTSDVDTRETPAAVTTSVVAAAAAVAAAPAAEPDVRSERLADTQAEPNAGDADTAPASGDEETAAEEEAAAKPRKPPLYWRLLRLQHVHPNGWQRAVLIEGVLAVAVVLVLAGKATIWTLLVLPVVAAVLVKLNDILAGSLVAHRPSADVGKQDPDEPALVASEAKKRKRQSAKAEQTAAETPEAPDTETAPKRRRWARKSQPEVAATEPSAGAAAAPTPEPSDTETASKRRRWARKSQPEAGDATEAPEAPESSDDEPAATPKRRRWGRG
jgi:hypothetical protein